MSKTILAIGAHYDDCPFGVPGILLGFVRRHYRVVVLNVIGNYEQWPPVKGRAKELVEFSVGLARERGIEMRFLDHSSMGFDASMELKRELAKHIADMLPDTALLLWPRDRHPDHEATSAAAFAALHQPARLLGVANVKTPKDVYWYDNGPGHTIDFTPDTYVNISDEWDNACDWLGRLMAFVKDVPYVAGEKMVPEAKSILARYRGQACGVSYAEAMRSVRPRPIEIQ